VVSRQPCHRDALRRLSAELDEHPAAQEAAADADDPESGAERAADPRQRTRP
jgi:hypothetical protein